MINDLDYEVVEFPVAKKYYSEIEQKNNICINVFCYENNLVYPKFKNRIDLLVITDENKWHYFYIKNFNRFNSNKTKNKKHFASIAYNSLVVKEF